jgi:branched-chain amino acid aminotransferase
MNLFCLWRTKQGKVQLITAPLDGTILPGIVRLSILQMVSEDSRFRSIVDEVTEGYYSIAELAEAVTEGRVMEIFGCGTGAVVCPVAGFGWNEKYYELQPKYDFAQKLMDAIQDIQYGTVASEWIEEVRC